MNLTKNLIFLLYTCSHFLYTSDVQARSIEFNRLKLEFNHFVDFSQCPRKDDEVYAGELLLGMKYSSGDLPISQTDLESLSSVSLASESGEGAGHLQVHVVEGAGIVDEETHKPFNTICKW